MHRHLIAVEIRVEMPRRRAMNLDRAPSTRNSLQTPKFPTDAKSARD